MHRLVSTFALSGAGNGFFLLASRQKFLSSQYDLRTNFFDLSVSVMCQIH